jgi:phage protein U
MFAVLGSITFQTMGSPSAFESALAFDYAKHKVVEARPRLQWIANDLEEITLDVLFHAAFCQPTAQMDALLAAANAHQAMALVFGNGVHAGYFVITNVTKTLQQLTAKGSYVSVQAKITLQEWALGADTDAKQAPTPTVPPTAATTSSSASAVGAVTGVGSTFKYSSAFNPHNLLSTDAIATFAATGAVPAGTSYVPPTYNSPGVSAIANSPTPTAPGSTVVTPGDVPPTTIARMDP